MSRKLALILCIAVGAMLLGACADSGTKVSESLKFKFIPEEVREHRLLSLCFPITLLTHISLGFIIPPATTAYVLDTTGTSAYDFKTSGQVTVSLEDGWPISVVMAQITDAELDTDKSTAKGRIKASATGTTRLELLSVNGKPYKK